MPSCCQSKQCEFRKQGWAILFEYYALTFECYVHKNDKHTQKLLTFFPNDEVFFFLQRKKYTSTAFFWHTKAGVLSSYKNPGRHLILSEFCSTQQAVNFKKYDARQVHFWVSISRFASGCINHRLVEWSAGKSVGRWGRRDSLNLPDSVEDTPLFEFFFAFRCHVFFCAEPNEQNFGFGKVISLRGRYQTK